MNGNFGYTKMIRLLLVLLVGALLLYLTYQSRYHHDFLDEGLRAACTAIGALLFCWTVVKDAQHYRAARRLIHFWMTGLCTAFLTATIILTTGATRAREQPTLLRVFYNGDFNGTGIDFKRDGTYVLDNGALGMSDYFYGTYTISGDRIVLDKDRIDNLSGLKYLRVQSKPADSSRERYLYQTDSLGHLLEDTEEYRVVEDHRAAH